ncbi:sigma-54-dependent Fis family transcriptional regulator [Paenibacillus agricola]|uniref:Sigma 54-interacting transcriptional regulator n=1 Tax=Paenibacillus agricola TaxID=2716264 RepID=A0ABX0JDC0_9BACL|nr:sigma 54-interacting transcriptional regulator [Paenibacillus agricola]NHN32214.1 sigma 54-interacting transcriptional regulator [Paenibacillus agricola]
MQLKQIQSSIQQVVVAIASVLKIEVEVADRQLFRVAGTGVIKSHVWQEMRDEDFVYRKCIESGESVVIERPGKEEICRPCLHFGNCSELGEVCCPIKVEGTTIGVIGLLAFKPDQRERLFGDLPTNLTFLQKMAELIASKMIEHYYYEEQLIIKQQISTLIHYIDHGIVMVNPEGECDFINPAARRLLRLPASEELDHASIEQLLENLKVIKSGNVIKGGGQTIMFRSRDGYRQLYANCHRMGKDGDPQHLVVILQDPEQIVAAANQLSEDMVPGFAPIIGKHDSILLVKDFIRKMANSRSPILIRGEQGTGKQFFSEYIHRYSERRDKPYLTINCAVLSEEALLVELFGQGSFDPSKSNRLGKLELAKGGTLFLDDISDMSQSVQLKLLRAMEEKSFAQGDSSKQIMLDVRIIAATDKELESLVSLGLFRQDLYYKLNVIPLQIPPLRERREDILLLAQHFLDQHAKTNRKLIRSMDEGFRNIALAHPWPGNIRELSNVLEYAINMESSHVLTQASMPPYLRDLAAVPFDLLPNGSLNLRAMEKEVISRAITLVKERDEPKERAAELLGIGRATLFRKLHEYKL